jgi:hypothetical protein
MKKKIGILMAAFILSAGLLFANSGKNAIPESVVSAFNRGFSCAKEVQWEGYGSYYKVTFNQHGNTLYVFYSDNGELMGTANNILSDKLPDLLQSAIKTKYQGYWITDLVKYDAGDQTGFIVTVENADEKIVLKTSYNHHWQVYTKENKV